MISSRNKCAATLLACLLLLSSAQGGPPTWAGVPWAILSADLPDLSALEISAGSIVYQPLDKWLRASRVIACLGPENLVDTYRAPTSALEPAGWQPDAYDFIPGASLYHRCHLLADSLGGAEIPENLITGTQYLNTAAMLPIESRVLEYIRRTGHHVLYSVCPYYAPGNYVCFGVQIEAASVEDDELRLNRYCFNVQPGVAIDYRTGFSRLAETAILLDVPDPEPAATDAPRITYVLNTSRMRFHRPDCDSVTKMSPKNRQETTLDLESLIRMGYVPCGSCRP